MEAGLQKIYKIAFCLLIWVFFGVFSVQAALPKVDTDFQFYNTEYFSFQFKNDHSVKRFEDIWYVQHNTTKQTSFVIFKRSGKVFYEPQFDCGRFFNQTEYCASKVGVGTVVKDLKVKTRSQAFEPFSATGKEAFDFFEGQDVRFTKTKDFNMVTRAEALAFILKWNNPGKKYQSFADDCFADIAKSHPQSGKICYAKSQGIIKGIDGKFYPDLGINLWGVLQMAHQNFGVPVQKFTNWELVEPEVLAGINQHHLALGLVASAYHNGVVRSEANQSLWPNKVLNQAEFIDVLYRFWRWKNGVKLKEFNSVSYESVPEIYRENRLISYRAKSYKKKLDPALSDSKPKEIVWKQTPQGRLLVYEKITEGVFQYLFSLQLEQAVKSADLWWEAKKFTGKLKLTTEKSTNWYKIEPHKNILEQLPSQENAEVLQFLGRRNWLPNNVSKISNPNIPVVKLFLEPSQLQEMLQNRTTRERYVAWMEFVFPSGKKTRRAIRVKTRGNGSLGYVKPSFTVETFKDFSKKFPLEFLADGNEFKLRSVFSDETMIREKLWYDVFHALQRPAPEFTAVLVELNGQPFGVYQLVEPIKKQFFKRRNIITENYFYAKNSGSKYNPNLTWLGNSETTLSQYKTRGGREKFLEFIQNIASTKHDIMSSIQTDNVLDYAWLTYFLNGWDSVSRNFYVYFDAKTSKWNMFPWDGDESFQSKNLTIDADKFTHYMRDTTGNFNQLFLYISHFVSDTHMLERGQKIKDLLTSGWVKTQINLYQKTLGRYFEYDNKLWNGKALERRKSEYNTDQLIEKLKDLWE